MLCTATTEHLCFVEKSQFGWQAHAVPGEPGFTDSRTKRSRWYNSILLTLLNTSLATSHQFHVLVHYASATLLISIIFAIHFANYYIFICIFHFYSTYFISSEQPPRQNFYFLARYLFYFKVIVDRKTYS